MSILNKLLKNTNTSAENKLQRKSRYVQSAFEESESEKEASIRAVNAAIEEIKNNPQMPIGEFLSKLQKNTDLKDSDIVKIIKQLPDLKSEEAVLSAVESTDLSSKEISGIIKNTDISTDTAQKIVEQIPDEDIKKEQKSQIEKMVEEEQTRRTKAKEDSILSQLSKIYNSCDSLEDTAIVELISQLNIENRTKNISDKIMDIVAKRTALDCMKYGTPRLPTLTKLVSSLDMFEANLPFLAQKEYKTISKEYDSKGKNYRQFDDSEKELIRNSLIEDIAKKSAQTFDELGTFNIPQTQRFKTLDKDDIELFVHTVKTYSNELSPEDTKRLSRQLKGEKGASLSDVSSQLEKMSPGTRDSVLDYFFTITNSVAQGELDISALTEIASSLKLCSPHQQEIVAKSTSKVLNARQENHQKIIIVPQFNQTMMDVIKQKSKVTLKEFYFTFFSLATKKPSYNSVGHTHIVPLTVTGKSGIGLSSFIGIISILLDSKAFSIISSFSFFKIEHVEYIISPPVFKIFNAFINRFSCALRDLLINSSEKLFSNTFSVPLPLHGASSKILSNEK